MNWSYTYPASEAMHRPTSLKFSIAYDPIRPDRKIKLASEKPDQISDVDVAALIQELQQLIQDQYLRRRMESLLHSTFRGEFARVADILEQQTKKKVSARTLQAWIMPPDRPSSRRCPEWAVAALEEYVAHNPDDPSWWDGVIEVRRSTPEGQTLEREMELRDRELLRHAENHIAREDTIRKEWQETAVRDIPERLADMEISVLERVEDHADLFGDLLNNLRGCDTFEDFKREVLKATERHYQSARRLKETAKDIRERRREFSTEDGTLPN